MRFLGYAEVQHETRKSPRALLAYLVVIVPTVALGAMLYRSPRWGGAIITLGIVVHYLRLCVVADRPEPPRSGVLGSWPWQDGSREPRGR
jgi:hypothetical protein